MSWPSHGANPQYLYEAAGIEVPEQWIDFSANINPLGPPKAIKEHWDSFLSCLESYPDPYGLHLKRKIAEQEKIEENNILIGNGGAELISLVARLLAGKKVLIVQPAFSEYEKACQANDCIISYHQLEEQQWSLQLDLLKQNLNGMDAMFLCNPSNPTGIYYSHNEIIELLEACQEANCLLIIDEAFYDFVERYKTITCFLKKYTNLIILRSMTKMFSIPALRLGYAIASETIIKKMAEWKTHWSVNGIALYAGSLCLDDKWFIDETKAYIKAERERLRSFYDENHFEISASEVNFYLLRDPLIDEQKLLFTYLLQRGLIPRHTYNFPGIDGRYLRFAIKRSSENDRLMEALKEWRKQYR
ncbi:threonine-phosphate decarboxylase CobD [Bacillus sp. 03113]|uniref:threonine-phosphate decarboxylase CobD n=1 Tax=Bacillus sp. 03113 TaxID=2578211 RepID=UPI001141B282|nr:threonine-phosphate decarboxylase CobD [Bacillus sp. 03113]